MKRDLLAVFFMMEREIIFDNEIIDFILLAGSRFLGAPTINQRLVFSSKNFTTNSKEKLLVDFKFFEKHISFHLLFS